MKIRLIRIAASIAFLLFSFNVVFAQQLKVNCQASNSNQPIKKSISQESHALTTAVGESLFLFIEPYGDEH